MWPFTEFLVGIAIFLVGTSVLCLCLHFGRPAVRLSFIASILVQLLIFGGLFLDWGYDWLDQPAIRIALNSNIWIAVPHGLSLLIIVVLVLWGPSQAPWAVVLSVIQTFSFIPVIYFVEMDTDSSFLSPVPLASMYLSLLSSFLFLPRAWLVLPDPGTRWYQIALGPREDLIRSIQFLSSKNFLVHPPETVLDSGSASGRKGDATIDLTTRPFLCPPSYGLRIRFVGPAGDLVPPDCPRFAPSERFVRFGSGIEYQGRSDRGFWISGEQLWRFLEIVTERMEAAVGESARKKKTQPSESWNHSG